MELEKHIPVVDNLSRGEDRPTSRLTVEKVLAMRKAYRSGAFISHLAREFGVNEKTAHKVVKYDSWRHVE
jgi:hypothetical protein